jgi:hypothetical protein
MFSVDCNNTNTGLVVPTNIRLYMAYGACGGGSDGSGGGRRGGAGAKGAGGGGRGGGGCGRNALLVQTATERKMKVVMSSVAMSTGRSNAWKRRAASS